MPGNLFLPALTTSYSDQPRPVDRPASHKYNKKERKVQEVSETSETLKWACTQKITCSVGSKTSPRNIPAKGSNDVDT